MPPVQTGGVSHRCGRLSGPLVAAVGAVVMTGPMDVVMTGRIMEVASMAIVLTRMPIEVGGVVKTVLCAEMIVVIPVVGLVTVMTTVVNITQIDVDATARKMEALSLGEVAVKLKPITTATASAILFIFSSP